MIFANQIGIIADDLTEEQIREYALLDNKTNELAEWDFELLGEELADLNLGDFGSLINCLTFDLKDSISKRLKMDSPIDTSRKNICEYIFQISNW